MSNERRELMLRIIDLCDSVRKRGLDPFDIEVREFFDKLRELLPKLKKYEDLYLDIQAVLGLADVISHQGEWIKYKSSVLYLDPLLITLKLHALSIQELAEILVRSWHPIVELESLSPRAIEEARGYWANLPSLDERLRELRTEKASTEEIARKELSKLGILSDENFERVLEKVWHELREATGDRGEISYWDFICAKDFGETIIRAWLVSFLVSYGYAMLELKPIEEEIMLKPILKPDSLGRVQTFSVPIAISRDEWIRRREGVDRRKRSS